MFLDAERYRVGDGEGVTQGPLLVMEGLLASLWEQGLPVRWFWSILNMTRPWESLLLPRPGAWCMLQERRVYSLHLVKDLTLFSYSTGNLWQTIRTGSPEMGKETLGWNRGRAVQAKQAH